MQIRVLLTAPVIRSGVFTHICDLANNLVHLGVEPYLAVVNREKDSEPFCRQLLGCSYDLFRSTEDLIALAENRQVSRIHAHSPLTLNASLEVAKRMSIPLIITLHGIIDWAALYPDALAYAAHIIATGPEAACCAGPKYTKKISIIYNGVDLQRFKPAHGMVGTEPLRVIYFGRTKGIDTRGLVALDQAVGLMRRKGRNVEARLIGRASGVFAKNLIHCGWFDDPVPSLHWSHVAFARGRSLREAMACENVGFMLGEGYGGILREEDLRRKSNPSLNCTIKLGAQVADPDRIAADLSILDDNRTLLQSLRKEARQSAVNYFDIGAMVKQTGKVYALC